MTERENKVKIQVPEIVGEGTFEGFVETDIEAPSRIVAMSFCEPRS